MSEMDSRIDSGGVAGMGSALDPSLALIEVQSQNGQPSQTSAVMDGVTGVVDTIMAGTAEAQEKLESAVSEVAIAVKPIERASHKRTLSNIKGHESSVTVPIYGIDGTTDHLDEHQAKRTRKHSPPGDADNVDTATTQISDDSSSGGASTSLEKPGITNTTTSHPKDVGSTREVALAFKTPKAPKTPKKPNTPKSTVATSQATDKDSTASTVSYTPYTPKINDMHVGYLKANPEIKVYGFLKHYGNKPRCCYRINGKLEGNAKFDAISFLPELSSKSEDKVRNRVKIALVKRESVGSEDEDEVVSSGSDTEVPDARRLAASTQSGCAIKLPTPIRKSALGLRENPQKSMRSEDMVDPEDLTDNDDEEEEVEHGKAKGATTTKDKKTLPARKTSNNIDSVPKTPVNDNAAAAIHQRGIIADQNRVIKALRDQIKLLEQTQSNQNRIIGELRAKAQKQKPEQDIDVETTIPVEGVDYKYIHNGDNRGKLMSKAWKMVEGGGKNWMEWTVLQQAHLDMEYEGAGMKVKHGSKNYIRIPDGKNEGVLVEEIGIATPLVRLGDELFVKWTIREEIVERKFAI